MLPMNATNFVGLFRYIFPEDGQFCIARKVGTILPFLSFYNFLHFYFVILLCSFLTQITRILTTNSIVFLWNFVILFVTSS